MNPAIDSDTLSDQLTMLGLEVDELAPVAKPFTGVVVGEVLDWLNNIQMRIVYV